MPMYAYGILIGVVSVVVVWFLFVGPMERRVHERKFELMKRKLERNEERLRQPRTNEWPDSTGKDADSNPFSRNKGAD